MDSAMRATLDDLLTTWRVWSHWTETDPATGHVKSRRWESDPVDMRLPVTVDHKGTPNEKHHAAPAIEQIAYALGYHKPGKRMLARLVVEPIGEHGCRLHVTDKRDGALIGELLCVSHLSLNPIRD
jgi:hypothetical protein